MRKHWQWFGAAGAVAMLAVFAVSCGGTGGGGGHGGNPGAQFILNSNNAGRLILNIDPAEVDANKSDRIGLVATLTDNLGIPLVGVVITFTSDIPDISFIPGGNSGGRDFGQAVTDAHGNADIIAVAGATPTGTGAIVGTGAIFAQPPTAFGLRAQTAITLLDVGFIDGDTLAVIPSSEDVTEPAPGTVIFFNIIGGTPPYELKNEVSGVGAAIISQHCLPGCTENGGVLCIGSPCQSDVDCGAGSPDGSCVGPIKRCLASCHGTNCAGSRCAVDADCNDGSPTPTNVCKDSGQSIAYIIGASGTAGTHTFTVEDSAGDSVAVSVNVSFVCGNGVARGDEQCDLGDLRDQSCTSLGFVGGGTLLCNDTCKFDTKNCAAVVSPSPVATPTAPAPTLTVTATVPATVTPTPTPTLSPTPLGTPGVATNLTLANLQPFGGDNGNNTATTVIAANVTDSNGNPVADGTVVDFSIVGATDGAVITAQSMTDKDPQCDVTNFEAATKTKVLNQPGVAHACVTYPITSCTQTCFDLISCAPCTIVIDGKVSGTSAEDTKPLILPLALLPQPTPTSTP